MLVVTNCIQDTIHTIQFYNILWLVIWSGNNCSREQLFVNGSGYLDTAESYSTSLQYARINCYHKSEFHKNFQFHQQTFSTFLHFTFIPFDFAGPGFAARPCRICQVVFIGVAALVLLILGATWPSSSYGMPIPHFPIIMFLGVFTIFSVLTYFITTCQKARFPHTCDARKDESIWL